MNRDFNRARTLNNLIMYFGAIICIIFGNVNLIDYPKLRILCIGLAVGAVLISTIVGYSKRIPQSIKPYILIVGQYVLFASSYLGNRRIDLIFSVVTIFQIQTVYYFKKRVLLFQSVLTVIALALVKLFPCSLVYDGIDSSCYIFGVLYVVLQAIVLTNIISIRSESIENEKEWITSSNEIIKVIEKKCADAKVATRSKSSFLANMSHEIRTPINAVLGLNEMIINESEDEIITGYAKDARSAGNLLLNIVNNILDLSKIEAGKMELVNVKYELSATLNDLVTLVNMRAEAKGLSLILEVDETIPRLLYGDEIRIKQIITNLLTNAVKYTDKGTITFRVGYKKLEDFAIGLQISVEDTGIGLRPEDVEKLCKPFERFEQDRNRNVEGTGLGMAITQYFLNLMGSRLEVKSTYGKGSCFSFNIRQEVYNWECMGNWQEDFKQIKDRDSKNNVSFVAPEAHILVVDDVPINLIVFKGLIKETKIQIDTASSARDAISLCGKLKYDIIFMDHMMPDMDGVDALNEIKKDSTAINFDTPVVALTANAISGARDFYVEAGFEDYITKPIESTLLKSCIKRLLEEKIVKTDKLATEKANTVSADMRESIRQIPFIELDKAVEFSGDEEVYFVILEEFYATSDGRVASIEKYFNSGDIKNYTIEVHALKSSAKIIGDNELSEMARELEHAGNEKNIKLIEEKTNDLISRYKKLKQCLADIFENNGDENLPEIEADELSEAITYLEQAVRSYDADMASAVVKELGTYKLPESFVDTYRRIRALLAEVKFDEILGMISTADKEEK